MVGADYGHQPVLLGEVVEALNISASGIYVDGTFGRGGHAAAIMEQLDHNGRVIAMDKDPEAVRAAEGRFGSDPRFTITQGSFSMLRQVVASQGQLGKVNGVLLDLGVSSPQLDDPQRGFSFRNDGPLDMRMNTRAGQSAADWIARASEQEIASVLREYGEERYAKRIARAIVEDRQKDPITTTGRLAAIVAAANPRWEKGKDPATRSFQAIRIYINSELNDLQDCLEQLTDVLAIGGRVVVISFHSLEDRMVKRALRKLAKGEEYPLGLPVTEVQRQARFRLVGKAVFPTETEIRSNPRARSAVMRVAEKVH